MRIAFFVHAFPELSETFILRQVTGLIDRGHDVSIFTDAGPQTPFTHADVDTYRLMDRVQRLDLAGPAAAGLKTAMAIARHPKLAWRYLHAAEPFRHRLRYLARLRLFESERPFDIVHCHFGDIGLHYRYAAALWAAPLIVSFYGYDVPAVPDHEWIRRYQPLTRETHAVTVLGRQMAERVSALGFPPQRIRQMRLCVDPARFDGHALRNDGDPRLLSVARLVPKKGIEYGIRAFARIASAVPNLRYDVIGDGPLRPALTALADELGVSARVTFHGWRDETAVLDALRRSTVFLLPSVTAPDGDSEGTPVALIEASSCGVPVVSTRHAGIPEVVSDEHTGILVQERDVDGLTDALKRLFADAELRRSMGSAGRERVANLHACERVVAELEALYQSVKQ